MWLDVTANDIERSAARSPLVNPITNAAQRVGLTVWLSGDAVFSAASGPGPIGHLTTEAKHLMWSWRYGEPVSPGFFQAWETRRP
jgi:hypothetical protein